MREVELSRQAQRNQIKHDKRKRAPEEYADRDEQSSGSMQPPSQVHFDGPNLDVGMRHSPSQVQGFGEAHAYSLGLDTSGSEASPTTGFQAFDRWSVHDGFTFSPGLSQFVDGGNFDSPKADLWKDFPEQFNDPSLLTSSLYGLPVLSGPMAAMSGMQGQPPSFMGTDFPLYSESFMRCARISSVLTAGRIADNLQPSSGSNPQ